MNRSPLWVAIAAMFESLVLSGCATPLPPPPLTETDLQIAMVSAWVGNGASRLDLKRLAASDAFSCVDLHRGPSRLGNSYNEPTKIQRFAIRLGLRGDLAGWQKPYGLGNAASKPVDPALEARLNGATADALLNAVQPPQPSDPKPWPATCKQRTGFRAQAMSALLPLSIKGRRAAVCVAAVPYSRSNIVTSAGVSWRRDLRGWPDG